MTRVRLIRSMVVSDAQRKYGTRPESPLWCNPGGSRTVFLLVVPLHRPLVVLSIMVDRHRRFPCRVLRPEIPLRGDWYTTTTVALRFYELPPSATLGHEWSGMSRCARQFLERRLRPGFNLGPVHDVDVTLQFVSILIPHPEDCNRLVWTNIWKYPSLQMARKVPSSVLASWVDNGWQNIYLQL